MPHLQIYLILLSRFVGQNRPQFRASTIEDPGQVKDLVDRLEKHQNPGPEDSISFVQMELARLVWYVVIKRLYNYGRLSVFTWTSHVHCFNVLLYHTSDPSQP